MYNYYNSIYCELASPTNTRRLPSTLTIKEGGGCLLREKAVCQGKRHLSREGGCSSREEAMHQGREVAVHRGGGHVVMEGGGCSSTEEGGHALREGGDHVLRKGGDHREGEDHPLREGGSCLSSSREEAVCQERRRLFVLCIEKGGQRLFVRKGRRPCVEGGDQPCIERGRKLCAGYLCMLGCWHMVSGTLHKHL